MKTGKGILWLEWERLPEVSYRLLFFQGLFVDGKLIVKTRHIQVHLRRLLLQTFLMLHLIFNSFFIFLNLSFFIWEGQNSTNQTKKLNMFFLQLKMIFQTPVPLVLIKLCIYKDEFTSTYHQYQVNSQPKNV